MRTTVYCFEFTSLISEADLDQLELTIGLAIVGAQSLHGEDAVRLDVGYYLDREKRSCAIDGATPAGRDVAKLFAGFMRNEFGSDSYTVQRRGSDVGVQTVDLSGIMAQIRTNCQN